jgi:hypothetical protein
MFSKDPENWEYEVFCKNIKNIFEKTYWIMLKKTYDDGFQSLQNY